MNKSQNAAEQVKRHMARGNYRQALDLLATVNHPKARAMETEVKARLRKRTRRRLLIAAGVLTVVTISVLGIILVTQPTPDIVIESRIVVACIDAGLPDCTAGAAAIVDNHNAVARMCVEERMTSEGVIGCLYSEGVFTP